MKNLMHKSYSVLVSSRFVVNGLAYLSKIFSFIVQNASEMIIFSIDKKKSYCSGVLIFIESLQIYATNLRHFFVILNPITRTILF